MNQKNLWRTLGSGVRPTEQPTKDEPQIVARALDPATWAEHAHGLHESAELLWCPLQTMFDLSERCRAKGSAIRDEPGYDAALWGHSSAYLLVAGAAIETMLKAGAIKQVLRKEGRAGVLTPGNRLHKWLTTHNLRSLAIRVGLSLTDAQIAKYLDRFTEQVIWGGRYPLPKDTYVLAVPPSHDYVMMPSDEAEAFQPPLSYEVKRRTPSSISSQTTPANKTEWTMNLVADQHQAVAARGRVVDEERGESGIAYFYPTIGNYDRIYANKLFGMAVAAYENIVDDVGVGRQ